MGGGFNISRSNSQNDIQWVQNKTHDSQNKIDKGSEDLQPEIESDEEGFPRATKDKQVSLEAVDIQGDDIDIEETDHHAANQDVEAEGTERTAPLSESIGTASAYARLKDALMRALQKITHPLTKLEPSIGSYHKAALRYAEQYDAAKSEGRCTPEYLASLLQDAEREISGHFSDHPEELRVSKEVIEQEREYIRNLKFADAPDTVDGLPADLGDKTELREAVQKYLSSSDEDAGEDLINLLTDALEKNYDDQQKMDALTSRDMTALKQHLKDHLTIEGIFLLGGDKVMQNEKAVDTMVSNVCDGVAKNLKPEADRVISSEIDHLINNSNLPVPTLDNAGKLSMGGTDYTSLNQRAGLSSSPGSVMVYQSNTGEKVVLKRLDITGEGGQVSTCKLVEAKGEIEAHLKIQSLGGHDNIVGLQGLCRGADGNLYMVLAYAEGGGVNDMARKVNSELRAGNIDVNLARNVKLTLLRDMAEGIAFSHNKANVIHGDIKSPNFFITDDGTAKLGDFGTSFVGISRVAAKSSRALNSQDTFASVFDRVPDSPFNVAPEMLRQKNDGHNKRGVNVDQSSDVWAYGMTAYHVLNVNDRAIPPHLRSEINSVVEKNMMGQVEEGDVLLPTRGKDLALIDHGISDEERDFVNWLTDFDPSARPSMDEILQHSIFSNLGQTEETDARSWMMNHMG